MTITYATGTGRFATRADLARYGLPVAVLAGIATADQDAALDTATAELGDLIASRVTLPLSAWPLALALHTARAASYHPLRASGFNQDSTDAMVRDDYKAALAWAAKVDRALITPQFVDATPTVTESTSSGVSNASRGWRRR